MSSLTDEESEADLSVEALFSSLNADPNETNQREPFKFLDPYSVNDRDLFFGRDEEISELYRAFYKSRLLLVYGESGSGKTSLLQCGLASEIPPEDAKFFTVRSALEPLKAIANELQRKTNFAESKVPTDLMELLREAAFQHSKTLVVVFDQFEELFIFHPPIMWDAVAEELKRWLASDIDVRIVLSIRQEFFAQLTELERMLPFLFNNRIWVRRMTGHKAREVITGPCERLSIPVEEGLVEDLIHDLSRDGKGVELPILQVVLDRLYRDAVAKNSNAPELQRKAYEDQGRVGSILQRFVEERVSNSANPDRVRQVLKALVTSDGTKRVSSKSDIRSYAAPFGPPLDEDSLGGILQQLVDDRILREDPDHHLFELRHDALAATIHSWLTGLEKELLEVRSSLENRAKEFTARDRAVDALLDPGFIEYLDPYLPHLNLDGDLLNLIKQSRAHIETSTTRRRRAFASIATTMIVVLGLLSTIATFKWLEASTSHDEALLAQTKAEANEKKATDANIALSKEQADFGHFIEGVLGRAHQSMKPVGILLDSGKHDLLLRVYNSGEPKMAGVQEVSTMQEALTSAVVDALKERGVLTQFESAYSEFTRQFMTAHGFTGLLKRSEPEADGTKRGTEHLPILEQISNHVAAGELAVLHVLLSEPKNLNTAVAAIRDHKLRQDVSSPEIELAVGSYYFNLDQLDLAVEPLSSFALHFAESGLPCDKAEPGCDQFWPAVFALIVASKHTEMPDVKGTLYALRTALFKQDLEHAGNKLVRDELSWALAHHEFMEGNFTEAATIATKFDEGKQSPSQTLKQAFFYHHAQEFKKAKRKVMVVAIRPEADFPEALCDMVFDLFSTESSSCKKARGNFEEMSWATAAEDMASLALDFHKKSQHANASFFKSLQIVTALRSQNSDILSPESQTALYDSAAKYLLLNKQYEQARWAANEGLAIGDSNVAISLAAQKAHALWLLGVRDDALQIYGNNVGQKQGFLSWKDLVRRDLELMSKAGIEIGNQQEIENAISIQPYFQCQTSKLNILIDGGEAHGGLRFRAWDLKTARTGKEVLLFEDGKVVDEMDEDCRSNSWTFFSPKGDEYRVSRNVSCLDDAPSDASGVVQIRTPEEALASLQWCL